jgi:hypothetical protein
VPFVSVHGTEDQTVGYNRQIVNPGVPLMYLDGSRMLHEQANALGINNPFYTYYGAGHGFYVGTSASALAYMDTTQNVITDFLVDMLGCSNPPLQSLNTPAQTANLYSVVNCNTNVPFEDCTALALDESDLFDQLTIFPNPAREKIEISGIPQNANLSILDLNGREVISRVSASGNLSIDLSGMGAGVYIVLVNSGGTRTMRKLIIE